MTGFLIHGAIFLASYVIALGLRFDFDTNEMLLFERSTLAPLMLLTLRLIAVSWWGLNRRTLRYLSSSDVVETAKAYLVSSILFAAAALLLRIPNFPRTSLVIEVCLSTLIFAALGVIVRSLAGGEGWSRKRGASRRDVVILGAGDSGSLVVRNLLAQTRLSYSPRAFLDDNERMLGATVHGVPVLGTIAELERTLAKFPSVSAVIVAIPSLSESRLSSIRAACSLHGVLVKRVQSFEDIACHDSFEPHGAAIENLLEKSMTFAYESEIRSALEGKRVLVTGAGGSIGSELTRQLLKFRLESLTLLDSSEHNLYEIEREIRESSRAFPMYSELANVRDLDRLGEIFSRHRPHVVFHAAAYKHVPILESHPHEAFRNNILGTRNLLTVSHVHRAERLILVSTDKAVEPRSVMGCTKRIAELLIQEYTARGDDRDSGLGAALVRFGNVMNSNGSVIPLFKDQIHRGGPITVTDPEVERYFMSLREAVELTLAAGILGDPGGCYVLEMGKPIKIVDIARKMLALYGRRDIALQFVGLRPGEKITEALIWNHERLIPTRLAKILRVVADADTRLDPRRDSTTAWVAKLEAQLTEISADELRRELFQRASGKASHTTSLNARGSGSA